MVFALKKVAHSQIRYIFKNTESEAMKEGLERIWYEKRIAQKN